MKKYFSAILAVTFIVGLCGCGDNKTKEKLYGTSLISASNPGGGNNGSSSSAASSADMASSAMQAAQLGVEMAQSFGTAGPTAPRRALKKKTPGMPTYIGAGWFSFTYGSYTMEFRFLNSLGSPVSGTSIDTLDFDAIARINLKMNAQGTSMNLTMDTEAPIDGNITITSAGMTYTCVLTGITYDDLSGNINGGSINVRCGGWTVALTYNSDSSASGTITGPSYSATVSISSDGTGTYTDSEGTHQIS